MDIRDLADTLRTRDRAFRQTASAGDALTEHSRALWSAGEYDRIASGFRHEAQAFVDRQELTSGSVALRYRPKR